MAHFGFIDHQEVEAENFRGRLEIKVRDLPTGTPNRKRRRNN